MKKIKFLPIIAIIVISLLIIGIGCDKEAPAEEETTVEEAPAEEETAAEEEFVPEETEDLIYSDELEATFGAIPDVAEGTVMGAVMKNLANEFWLALDAGYQKGASNYGIKVDTQATRSETDYTMQLGIAEAMFTQGYDAFILSPLSNENLDSIVADIKAEGLPIVNVNCEFISDADTFLGVLQLDVGHLAGEYLGQVMGGKGKLAILEGVPGTYTSDSRVYGCKEIIESKYPDIEIVTIQPADYEREKGMNVTANILTANPDINAIFGANDNMALGAIEALRTMDMIDDVIVIGVDGTASAYESIEKGELTGTIDQFPAMCGEIAIDVAVRMLGGQVMPRVIATPIEMIDSSNIEQYMK